MKKNKYFLTVRACGLSYLVQGILNNFIPLLFIAEIAKIKNLKNADLSDTISGLDYNEAQDVLDTFVNCLKELDINLLNLSDNAIGPEGINSLRPLITVSPLD